MQVARCSRGCPLLRCCSPAAADCLRPRRPRADRRHRPQRHPVADAEPDVPATAAAARRCRTLGTYSTPVWVGTAPGDTIHLFLVEKTGRVLLLDGSGRFESVVLDVTKRITKANEQGLLSMAFDPGFATNHRFYVFLTDKDDDATG